MAAVELTDKVAKSVVGPEAVAVRLPVVDHEHAEIFDARSSTKPPPSHAVQAEGSE